MTTCLPFHIKPLPGAGEVQVVGARDERLVLDLEVLAGGVPFEAPYEQGGPLVARRPHTRQWIIGWARGRPGSDMGRQGMAWEAWGILAPPDARVRPWAWLWKLLSAEPEERTLNALAAALGGGFRIRPSDAPPEPASMLRLVTAAHEQAARADTARAGSARDFRLGVPVGGAADTPLLAWLWLLGPVGYEEATVGPPRGAPAAAVPAPTYEGITGGGAASAAGAARPSALSPLLADIQKVLQADPERGFGLMERFRGASPEARMYWLARPLADVPGAQTDPVFDPLPAKSAKANRKPGGSFVYNADSASGGTRRVGPEADPHEGGPQPDIVDKASGDGPASQPRSGLHAGWRWARAALPVVAAAASILSLLLLLHIHRELHRNTPAGPGVLPGKAAVAPARPASTAPAAPAAPAAPTRTEPPPATNGAKTSSESASANCSAEITSEWSRALADRMLDRIDRARVPADSRFLQDMRALASQDAVGPDAEALRRKLAGAAVQIYLNDKGCAGEIAIDGDVGPRTRSLLEKCAFRAEAGRLADDPVEALRWLCEWASRP